MLGRSAQMDVDDPAPAPCPTVGIGSSGKIADRQLRPPRSEKYDQARRDVRKFSRGIFKPPPSHRGEGQPKAVSKDPPALPPKDLADQLVSAYHDVFSGNSILFFWPDFLRDYERVYRARTFVGVPQIWVSMFFVILATGSLQTSIHRDGTPSSAYSGSSLFQEALRNFDTSTDEIAFDFCRVAFMISVYCVEDNRRIAGKTWLALATCYAMEIGLHDENGSWPQAEVKLRRRFWWALYSWDRYLLTFYLFVWNLMMPGFCPSSYGSHCKLRKIHPRSGPCVQLMTRTFPFKLQHQQHLLVNTRRLR